MIIETQQTQNKRPRRSNEGKIQSSCYLYFWENYPQYRGLYFAVPNENSRSDSNAISGGQRKAMGVYHGVADTLMLIPRGRYHGLAIEYKDEHGRQSVHQIAWQSLVESQGYKYCLCRSLAQFKEIIQEYFNQK